MNDDGIRLAIETLHESMNQGFDGINKRLDGINGRVRELEKGHTQIKTIWSIGAVAAALFGDSIKHKLGL